MDVCYEWCRGATFYQICQMTDIFEGELLHFLLFTKYNTKFKLVILNKYWTFSGSIIRAMRRLEEILRQLIQASKSIGNTDLENKFSESIKIVKRDIVFAASLYLWNNVNFFKVVFMILNWLSI